MNRSHSGLTDWGLEHVRIEKTLTILDVGCGGGRTIEKLAAAASGGQVFGVDCSRASVDASRARNTRAVENGHVEVRLASVSHLPFPDAMFDLVIAVETHYYWPDLPGDLREVLRVIKPGGMAIVIAETYKGNRLDFVTGPAMRLLRAAYMSVEEHRAWFAQAGFAGVEVIEQRKHGWICVKGTKPGGDRLL
jgi:ubiquinone/menaquinone biosynthesis C-methylase UbiE